MDGSKPDLLDGTLVLWLRPNGVPLGLLCGGCGVLCWALGLYCRGSSPRGCFIFCHAVKTLARASASFARVSAGRCAVGGGRKFLLVNLSAPVV